MDHPVPTIEFASKAAVGVSPRFSLGQIHGGERRVVPITGGTVTCPLLCGRVLPGGADWQLVQPDGLIDLTARCTIEAENGTLIGVVNRGLRHGPPDEMARLAAGEAVATGQRHPDGVLIRFFVVR